MKKAFLKVVCMGVITAVLFGMTCLTGCSTIKKYINKADNAVLDYEDNGGEIQIQRATSVLNAESGYVEETVTAILTPSTVANKAVDWSIEWADNAPLKNSAISDYLTVTPDSDGSLTAKVRCYKSFRGSSAVLSVTTRIGEVKGSCSISFVGKPATGNLNLDNYDLKCTRGNLTDVIVLYVDSQYHFYFNFDNIFHDVGTGLVSGYQCSVEFVGSAYYKQVSSSSKQDISRFSSECLSYQVGENSVTLRPKSRYEDCKLSNMSKWSEDVVDNDGNLPYIKVTISANEGQFSQTFNIYIDVLVDEVNVDKTDISF